MKFSIIMISFLISILFLTHLTLPTMPVASTIKSDNNMVVAYFLGGDIYRQRPYNVEDIYPIAHKLTHLIYAFAKPNPENGTCGLQDPWVDIGVDAENYKKVSGNFAKLLALKKKFPHLKILLSIGGGVDSKHISSIVQKGYAHTFVASCISLLDTYNYDLKGQSRVITFQYKGLFDGIDLDWEWVNNNVPENEAKAYVDMILLCKKMLQEREKRMKSKQILTSALQVNASIYKNIDLKRIVSSVDWFNVMTYDFFGPWNSGIGFNAPIYHESSIYSIDNSIQKILSCGVPSKKLVLGIPLYGYAFDQTKGKLGSTFKKTNLTRSLSYATIKKKYLTNPSCDYTWHDLFHVPSLYCSADKIFISFEDEKSVKAKVKYARQNRLGGVMFWRLATDDDDHSLVNALE